MRTIDLVFGRDEDGGDEEGVYVHVLSVTSNVHIFFLPSLIK